MGVRRADSHAPMSLRAAGTQVTSGGRGPAVRKDGCPAPLSWQMMCGIPARLELTAGEQRPIELPGLGMSGYVWDHEIVGEDGVVDVEWVRGDPPGSPPRPVGVSAPQVATIRAVRPGAVDVRLYQHRRWEPPDRIRAEHRLSVLVRPRQQTDPLSG